MAAVAVVAHNEGYCRMVLGLPARPAPLQEKEIHRAFRARSKRLHPDKRPQGADASAEWTELLEARDFLIDRAVAARTRDRELLWFKAGSARF